MSKRLKDKRSMASLKREAKAVERYRDKYGTKFKRERTFAKKEARADMGRVVQAMDARSIFTIVFAILLLIALLAGLTGTENTRTFSGFLQFLTSAPKIPTDWVSSIQFDWGDWGFFDFLQNFLQSIWSGFSGFLFIGTAIVNSLILIFWFLAWILAGF